MPGPNPTILECFAQLSDCWDYVNEREKHGNSNTPNVYGLYDIAVGSRDGEFTPAGLSPLNSDRVAAAAILTPPQLQAIANPHHLEALRKYALPLNGSFEQRFFKLVEKLHLSSEKFKSRGMTFGSPTFPTATSGTGVIRRCTVDRHGYNLECTGAEAKKAECSGDQTGGARKHRETFRFEGATPERDALAWSGSGVMGELAAADAASSGILRNASFETNGVSADNTAPASTTAVTGWTLSAAASFLMRSEATRVYRGFDGLGTGTAYSLEFVASGTATQTLLTTSPGTVFRQDVPYHCQIAWQRRSSATGTLKLKLGAIEVTVNISTGTNNVWNLLILPLGANSWYRQFGAAQDLTVTITTTSLATGTVIVDDCVLSPMANMDGTYYLPVGGATPFLIRDKATWTDTDGGTRAIHSYWHWRTFLTPQRLQAAGGVWLPTTATASAITIPD